MTSAIIARTIPPVEEPKPLAWISRKIWLGTPITMVGFAGVAYICSPVAGLWLCVGLGILASLLATCHAWATYRQARRRRRRPVMVETIFCADDTDLEQTLPRCYKGARARDQLFALGNLVKVGLSPEIGTVAFARDRDEPYSYNAPQLIPADSFRRLPFVKGQARVWFLYEGNKWMMKDGRTSADSWEARRVPWRELDGGR